MDDLYDLAQLLLSFREAGVITPEVYKQADKFLWLIGFLNIEVPMIFYHEPDSVVLDWTMGDTTMYVTISKDNFSVLLSNKDNILVRKD